MSLPILHLVRLALAGHVDEGSGLGVVSETVVEGVGAAWSDGQLEWRHFFVTGGSPSGLGHLRRLVGEGSSTLGEEGHSLGKGKQGAGAGAGKCGRVGSEEWLGEVLWLWKEGERAGAWKLLAQFLELAEHYTDP